MHRTMRESVSGLRPSHARDADSDVWTADESVYGRRSAEFFGILAGSYYFNFVARILFLFLLTAIGDIKSYD